MTDLHYLSATEVLAAFQVARALAASRSSTRSRPARTRPSRRSTACSSATTRTSARPPQAAAERYAGKGEPPRPLEGLPVVLKEEQPIAGRAACASARCSPRAWSPTRPTPSPERVYAAGALVHARTTTPEFSCAGFTHSDLWGVTRNPWNPDYTPGGSSGGSGAALASGTAYLATGSDIGGSIRIPASFCGVVGFKAPYGRVPALPPFNLDIYCHDGAMGRTVADIALLHNVIQGQHPVDHVSLPALPIPERPRRRPRDADRPGGDARRHPGRARGGGQHPRLRRGAAQRRCRWSRRSQVDLSLERMTEAALVHYGSIMGPSMSEEVALDDPRFMDYTRSSSRSRRPPSAAPASTPGWSGRPRSTSRSPGSSPTTTR